jgi:RNA recognition motif-containing protein
VAAIAVITDNVSGQSRGFGFVEMPSTPEAQAAITGLNGQELKGRALHVNEARPRVAATARRGDASSAQQAKRISPRASKLWESGRLC